MANPYRVYLCGPMAANTPEQAGNWRATAADILSAHCYPLADGSTRYIPSHITCISPMREKHMLTQGTIMGVDYKKYGEVPELRAQSILTRDCYDVDHADVILANFTELGHAKSGEPIPSLGSDVEMGRAHVKGIPIVMVAPEDNYYRKHPFSLVMANITFDTLEPACDWILRNFKPYF